MRALPEVAVRLRLQVMRGNAIAECSKTMRVVTMELRNEGLDDVLTCGGESEMETLAD